MPRGSLTKAQKRNARNGFKKDHVSIKEKKKKKNNNIKNLKDSPEITISYASGKLKNYVENSPEIKQTIVNIKSSGFGGSIGTSQSKKVASYNVKHQHVRGRDAIAFTWTTPTNLHIAGYGTKHNSAPKGTGGYKWNTKPK